MNLRHRVTVKSIADQATHIHIQNRVAGMLTELVRVHNKRRLPEE